MAFTIKNISLNTLTILGQSLTSRQQVDLLSVTNASNIKSSLLVGDLYKYLQGRQIQVVDGYDFTSLSPSTSELAFYAAAGFLNDITKGDVFEPKAPFAFTSDGYLQTTASIGSITVESQSEVEGRVLDGYSATGIKPVITAGVDSNGNAKNLAVTTDGYLNVVTLSYDIPTNSDKVFPIYDVSDKWSNETPLEITGTGLVTGTYDIDMRGYKSCGIQIIGSSAVDGYIKFAIQESCDTAASPDFTLVTASTFNKVTNAVLGPDGSGDIAVPNASTNYYLYIENAVCVTLRIRLTVTAHASNTIQIHTYKSF